ncbi:hypothetical protein AUK40_05130 [Candidatus Wirthbacteria bacterium CG2_30_54_11]|uniref:CBS domain-containing protein n=1 Tax=Candidatus Wirthbacteria bacterium CG2_30_54_11 TaxID=1817892 RepID=A0A1J5IYI6_9BACT|nr:MAG: hypothetical protein AUK40_05130 [Candidatus Wirthbacteria bacterium CG2_30_54_11]
MIVSSIMNRTVQSVRPETSVHDIIDLIVQHGFSGVPVVDAQGILVGIVSEKDILRRLFPSYGEFMEDPVSGMQWDLTGMKKGEVEGLLAREVMTTTLVTVEEKTETIKACALMTARRVRRLPVVDQSGRLTGIVSQGDVFRALLKYATQ